MRGVHNFVFGYNWVPLRKKTVFIGGFFLELVELWSIKIKKIPRILKHSLQKNSSIESIQSDMNKFNLEKVSS